MVVAILGILSSVGVISYNGYVKSAKMKTAENILQQVSLAQLEYYTNTGEYYPDVRFEDFAGEWLYSGEPGQYPAAGVEDEGIAASLVEDYEVKYGDESDNGSDDGEDGDY